MLRWPTAYFASFLFKFSLITLLEETTYRYTRTFHYLQTNLSLLFKKHLENIQS